MALTNSQQPTGNRQLATSRYGVTLGLHHFVQLGRRVGLQLQLQIGLQLQLSWVWVCFTSLGFSWVLFFYSASAAASSSSVFRSLQCFICIFMANVWGECNKVSQMRLSHSLVFPLSLTYLSHLASSCSSSLLTMVCRGSLYTFNLV